MNTKNSIKLNKFADLSKLSTKLCVSRVNHIATFYSIMFLIIILFHFYISTDVYDPNITNIYIYYLYILIFYCIRKCCFFSFLSSCCLHYTFLCIYIIIVLLLLLLLSVMYLYAFVNYSSL